MLFVFSEGACVLFKALVKLCCVDFMACRDQMFSLFN